MTPLAIVFIIFVGTASCSMICEHNCETEEFDPVCGVNPYNELRMFANLCHLETTICEDSMGNYSFFFRKFINL